MSLLPSKDPLPGRIGACTDLSTASYPQPANDPRCEKSLFRIGILCRSTAWVCGTRVQLKVCRTLDYKNGSTAPAPAPQCSFWGKGLGFWEGRLALPVSTNQAQLQPQNCYCVADGRRPRGRRSGRKRKTRGARGPQLRARWKRGPHGLTRARRRQPPPHHVSHHASQPPGALGLGAGQAPTNLVSSLGAHRSHASTRALNRC